MADEYPLSHVFGEFPEGVIDKLCKGVAKRKVELVALRNTKFVRSSAIEGLLMGPGQPFEMIGYQPKKTFSLGESGRAILDGYHPELKVALEIEKGRILLGNQLYVDLYKFIAIDEIEYAAIIVPTISREGAEKPFSRCVVKMKVLEPKLEALGIKGLAIIGY
jgi:hypothetical protein